LRQLYARHGKLINTLMALALVWCAARLLLS